ncbi:MAG TPA: hypothetical protein PKA82_03615 [Pyrinomonadaceae bacterium]|nr:hypothetical protein [Pyrinomonadaceae bacterium]
MKLPVLILAILMAAASAAGQVLTAKDDISAEKYFAAENRAAELLKTANYRSVWTKEYFADRSKAAELQEKTTFEVTQPLRWRKVEEKFRGKGSRKEFIFDGKDYFFRFNDEPWEKVGLGNGSGGRIFRGQVTDRYRYLPSVDFEGKKVELYEQFSARRPTIFYLSTEYDSAQSIRTTRSWYSEGKLLKIVEDYSVEGYEDMLRETTTYEYDPKDLKIEAPVVK